MENQSTYEITNCLNSLKISVDICQCKSEFFVDINGQRKQIGQIKVTSPGFITFDTGKQEEQLSICAKQQIEKSFQVKSPLQFYVSPQNHLEDRLRNNKKKTICAPYIAPAPEYWSKHLTDMHLTEMLVQPFYEVPIRKDRRLQNYEDGCQLRQGDVIKLGKFIFYVSQTFAPTPKKRRSSNLMSLEQCESRYGCNQIYHQSKKLEGQCKICYSEENNGKQHILISPCQCKGSCQLVHFSCLKKWMERKIINRSDSKVKTIDFDKYRCQICKTQFPKVFHLMKRTFSMIQSSKPTNKPYIILTRINYQYSNGQFPMHSNKLMHIITPEKDKPFLIGRKSSSNDLVIQDLTVSRLHMEMFCKDDKFYIFDKQSRYGTLVSFRSNVKIEQERVIQIGRLAYRISKSRQIPEDQVMTQKEFGKADSLKGDADSQDRKHERQESNDEAQQNMNVDFRSLDQDAS